MLLCVLSTDFFLWSCKRTYFSNNKCYFGKISTAMLQTVKSQTNQRYQRSDYNEQNFLGWGNLHTVSLISNPAIVAGIRGKLSLIRACMSPTFPAILCWKTPLYCPCSVTSSMQAIIGLIHKSEFSSASKDNEAALILPYVHST